MKKRICGIILCVSILAGLGFAGGVERDLCPLGLGCLMMFLSVAVAFVSGKVGGIID